jgi:adenine-specific DNA-methyltransferase
MASAVSKPPKAQSSGPPGGLSPTSLEWMARGDPAQRKIRGQYMTPRAVAEALLDRVGLAAGMRVLDPGVGTGELLRAALDRETGLSVTGWDVDATAIEAARRLVPEADLEVRSALDPAGAGDDSGFDLVIGNPPYFQLRLDRAERQRFAGVLSGRANVFALFFQIGIEQLKSGGTIAYIVPPSMNSGAYFESLREYLCARTELIDLTVLEGTDLFQEANTAIQLLVLKKHGPKPAVGRIIGSGDENPTHRGFVFRREVPEAGFRRVLFSPDPGRLAAEFEGRKTLWELGLEAVTGQVIWNENRDRLKDGPGPGRVPLIWSHSIGRDRLELDGNRPAKPGKPGFYDTGDAGKAALTGPAIVVNRVVGAVGRGELRAALIPAGAAFIAENHVNVIRARRSSDPGGSDNRHQARKSDPPGGEVDWERVLAALLAPGVAGRIQLLTGNTQISTRELTHLVPLDQNPPVGS